MDEDKQMDPGMAPAADAGEEKKEMGGEEQAAGGDDMAAS